MSNTQWLLQHNMPLHFIKPFHKALQALNQEHTFFGYLGEFKQFTYPNESLSTNKPIIVRSGTGALKTLLNKSDTNTLTPEEAWLLKGYFYHPQNFDQAFLQQQNLPLLNSNSQIISMKELQHIQFDHDMFVKPTSDLKGFTASVLPKGISMAQHVQQLSRLPTYLEETCLVSPIKHLHSECRFFVVDKDVVAGSFYRVEDKPYRSQPTTEYWKVAHEYAQLFQPTSAFVMDITLTSDHEFKIVEYNCLNCSGTYDANIPSILDALNHIQR